MEALSTNFHRTFFSVWYCYCVHKFMIENWEERSLQQMILVDSFRNYTHIHFIRFEQIICQPTLLNYIASDILKQSLFNEISNNIIPNIKLNDGLIILRNVAKKDPVSYFTNGKDRTCWHLITRQIDFDNNCVIEYNKLAMSMIFVNKRFDMMYITQHYFITFK